MDSLRAAPLALALASAAIWAPLLDRTATLALAAGLAASLVWLWVLRGDSTLFVAFGTVALWSLGGLLWLASPSPGLAGGVPFALLAAVLIPHVVRRAVSRPAAVVLFAGLSLWLAVAWPLPGGAGQAGLVLAALALAAWTLPRVPARGAGFALAAVLIWLALAGAVQWDRTRGAFAALAADPRPWRSTETGRLEEWHRRFPQPGGHSTLAVRQALREGPESTGALRRALDALEANPAAPSVVAGVCRLLNAAGEGDLLAARVSADQVIASGSLDAARALAAALLAAERPSRIAPLRARFGDGLAGGDADGDGGGLLPVPVAGRQLDAVRVSRSTGESPRLVRPGERFRLDAWWRAVHPARQPVEVRLRLGTHDTALWHSAPVDSLPPGTAELLSREFVIPATIPADVDEALLVVTATPLSHEESFSLGVIDTPGGFRPIDPSNPDVGITEENRLRLFGSAGIALNVCATLGGMDAAVHILDAPIRVRRLAVISGLTAGRQVEQGAVVGDLLVSSQGGSQEAFVIVAGRDTAEVWHDYPPYAGQVRHGRPAVAWQTPRRHGGHTFHNTQYVMWAVLAEAIEMRAVRLRTALPPGTGLSVAEIVVLPE